ncbi:MAG TPA: NADH-quinone oxidoreductase subunit M [Polyangiaceae bacterium]|jgi:NADH-quinone oxidoreductase subunit M|nr:NADH-quinone oxidoreductase subunit M [Polyangiaceae bacterium]
MNDALSWVPVAAPLVGAVLVAFLSASDRFAQRVVAVVSSLIALGAAVLAYISFDPSVAGYQLVSRFGVNPDAPAAFGIELGFGYDTKSLPLVIVANIVGVCAFLSARFSAQDSERNDREHFALLLVALASCNGAFLSLNLFFFFFFAELGTLPKYLLVARWWRQGRELTGPKPAAIAMQMTLYILLGAMAFLGVMVLLSATVGGSLDFDALGKGAREMDPELQTTLYGILVFALGVWSSIWPLHAWAPPAYATAQAPTNMLFAGVAKSFGLYGLLRIGSQVLPQGAQALGEVVMLFGCINILYAGWAALKQTDWNRMLAYASISHAGYTFIAVGSGTALGEAAAITLMCAHGLITSLGFLLTDELDVTVGLRNISRLGGLAKTLPMLSVAFCVFAVAGAGFPGTAGFVGELMVFFAAWGAGSIMSQTAAVICVFGVILSATYVYRALHATFFGDAKPRAATGPGTALSGLPLVATVVLTLSTVLMGVYPRLVTDLFQGAAPSEEQAAQAALAKPRNLMALPERLTRTVDDSVAVADESEDKAAAPKGASEDKQ